MKCCTHEEMLVKIYARLGQCKTFNYYRDTEQALKETEQIREEIRLHLNWPEVAE